MRAERIAWTVAGTWIAVASCASRYRAGRWAELSRRLSQGQGDGAPVPHKEDLNG